MNRVCKELLKKNNAREKQIFKENGEVYTNMVVYLRGADMTEYNQELVRADLIEMILDGQERGDNIQQVMGECYQEICDEIIHAMPKRTKKEKFMYHFSMVLSCVAILGVIGIAKQMIQWIASGEAEYLLEVSLGNVVSGVVIIVCATCLVNEICRNAFEESSRKGRLLMCFFMFLVVFVVICMTVICNTFLASPSVNVHIAVVAAVVVLLGIAGRVVDR